MADQKLIVPDNVVMVGQSAGGWGALALASTSVPLGHFAAVRQGIPEKIFEQSVDE